MKNYYEKQHERVKKLFQYSKHKTFGNRNDLADWFVAKLKIQNCCCYYCDTSIHDIVQLINAGLIQTRAVRGEGKRGPNLEIDKQGDSYNKRDCVLACYYCNNDKSYTLSKEEYKRFFGKNRKSFFEEKLKLL